MSEWQFKDTKNEVLRLREQIKAKGLDDKLFCLVPFTTIILEPDGQVGICRQKGSDFPIGHIKDNTIAEIWNGDKARKWRREFLEGRPVNCSVEVRHRHCQHCTENNKLLHEIELSEIQTRPILKLTANFNGKCNLQCQMCDIWKKPNGLYDEINFWEPAKKEIFPYLKEVDLLSGEPFIQQDTYRLMSEIYKVNPGCQWTFTTNAHWKLTEAIKNDLDRIYIKNIIFSVDSFNEKNYYKIRYPGKLSFVLKNIETLLEYNETRKKSGLNEIRFSLNFLVQKDNWHEIKEAFKFCKESGIIPFMTFLYEPSTFSLLNLNEEERIELLMKMLNELSPSEIIHSMRIIMPLLDASSKLNKASALVFLENKLGEHNANLMV